MNPQEYLEGVLKTESLDIEAISSRLTDPGTIRLLHAVVGVGTEAGELLDQLKKHAWYGKELDRDNLLEEFGDLLWYIGVGLDALGHTFEEAMAANNRKLAARYKRGFSKREALERDTQNEMSALLDNSSSEEDGSKDPER